MCLICNVSQVLLLCRVFIFKCFIIQFLFEIFMYYLQERASQNIKGALKIISICQVMYHHYRCQTSTCDWRHTQNMNVILIYLKHIWGKILINICCSLEIVQNISQYLPRWQVCTVATLCTSSISAAGAKTSGLGFQPLIKFRKM